MEKISSLQLSLRRATRFVTGSTTKKRIILQIMDDTLGINTSNLFELTQQQFFDHCDPHDIRDYNAWDERITAAAKQWGSVFALKMAKKAYDDIRPHDSLFTKKARSRLLSLYQPTIKEMIRALDENKTVDREDIIRASRVLCSLSDNNSTFNCIEWVNQLDAVRKRSTDLAHSMANTVYRCAAKNSELRDHARPRLFSLTFDIMDATLASEDPTSPANEKILADASSALYYYLRDSDQAGWTSWLERFETAKKISTPLALKMADATNFDVAKKMVVPTGIEVMDVAMAEEDKKTFVDAYKIFCRGLEKSNVAHVALWAQHYDRAITVFGASIAPELVDISCDTTSSRNLLGQYARQLRAVPIAKAMGASCDARDHKTFENEHERLLDLCSKDGETGRALWVDVYTDTLAQNPLFALTMARQANKVLSKGAGNTEFLKVTKTAEDYVKRVIYHETNRAVQNCDRDMISENFKAILSVSPLPTPEKNTSLLPSPPEPERDGGWGGLNYFITTCCGGC